MKCGQGKAGLPRGLGTPGLPAQLVASDPPPSSAHKLRLSCFSRQEEIHFTEDTGELRRTLISSPRKGRACQVPHNIQTGTKPQARRRSPESTDPPPHEQKGCRGKTQVGSRVRDVNTAESTQGRPTAFHHHQAHSWPNIPPMKGTWRTVSAAVRPCRSPGHRPRHRLHRLASLGCRRLKLSHRVSWRGGAGLPALCGQPAGAVGRFLTAES